MLSIRAVSMSFAALLAVAAAARVLDGESPVTGCPASASSTSNGVETSTNSYDNAVSRNSDLAVEGYAHMTRNLRGLALSKPCCVSWGAGRVDCFFRGPKSSIMHMTVKKTEECCSSTDWEDLGGIFFGEVECVSRDVGYIDIFGIGDQWTLYVRSFSSNGWSPWINKGRTVNEVPSCAVRDKNTITCLMRNGIHAGFQITSTAGVWAGYSAISGTLMSPMACCRRAPSTFDCFGVGMNSAMYTKYLSAGKWGGWSSMGGQYNGRRPSAACASNRINVFALGYKNNIIQTVWDGNWKPAVDLGGMFESAPECVMLTDGKIICLAVGYRSDLFKNVYDGMQWSGWVNLFGRYMPEAPSCVLSNHRIVSCYVRNVYNEIMEIEFEM